MIHIYKNEIKMKILFATDGSAYSKAALKEIAVRPYPPQTSVHIISIINNVLITTYNAPMGVLNEFYVESGRKAEKIAEKTVRNAAKVLSTQNPELTITTAIINGSPKSVVLEEAEMLGADLIIVGSHGYGAVKRFMLGSVSQAVALHAKCSVEIVRIQNK